MYFHRLFLNSKLKNKNKYYFFNLMVKVDKYNYVCEYLHKLSSLMLLTHYLFKSSWWYKGTRQLYCNFDQIFNWRWIDQKAYICKIECFLRFLMMNIAYQLIISVEYDTGGLEYGLAACQVVQSRQPLQPAQQPARRSSTVSGFHTFSRHNKCVQVYCTGLLYLLLQHTSHNLSNLLTYQITFLVVVQLR